MEGFQYWDGIVSAMKWPDERRTGHLQKWYAGRVGKSEWIGGNVPPIDLHMPDNMIFMNVLNDQQRHAVLEEMEMRITILDWLERDTNPDLAYEVLAAAIGKAPKDHHKLSLANLLKSPAQVGDVWVLLSTLKTDEDMQNYLTALKAAQAEP